jgi:ABC-type transport system involved in multi-copper enzyme maturation permease subunit
LVILVLLFVPLLGLSLGDLSLAGERYNGSLLYLLALPICQAELLLG